MDSSAPAAHRCLPVSEIFQIIADFSCRYTMASLARTCKTLHKAALPNLWEHQSSLVPLLRLLPPDTWLEAPLANGGSIFQIIEPDKLDWTRFNYYAQHVRHFYWRERKDVSPLALSALSVYRPAGQPLLPRLRTLAWQEPRATFFSFAQLFLTPTLSDLGLQSTDFDPSVMMWLFEQVGAICPCLESLEIRPYRMVDADGHVIDDDEDLPYFTDVVGDGLAQLLRGLPELKRFEGLVYLLISCVEALAALPRFATLKMHVLPQEMDEIAASAACFSRDGLWFPALKVLELYVDQMDDSTTTFVGAIQSEDLLELSIESVYQSEAYTVNRHLDLVARSAYRDSLTVLQLEFCCPPCDDGPCPAIDVGDAFGPLYACPNINTVIFRAPLLVTSASAVRGIANAWRRLQILALISYLPHPKIIPCLTLEGLVPLARNCPKLWVLELHLAADKVPDAAVLARMMPEPSRCMLEILTAYNAPIEDGGKVAEYLTRLFPRLYEVAYRGMAPIPFEVQLVYKHKWMTVQELLKVKMAAANKEEAAAELDADADDDPK